jgi:hypothetical protein
MKTLRLPWSVSPASLRSANDTPSCLARSLTPAAKLSLGCQDVRVPVSSFVWRSRRGDRRISQVPREPLRTSALLLDPGRTVARGLWRSGAAPAGIRTKAPAIRIFRGSMTQLLCPPPTLKAAISDDSPRLASGWLPPFPGGALVPTGFLQRISASNYIASFLSGFLLALYAGLPLTETKRSDSPTPTRGRGVSWPKTKGLTHRLKGGPLRATG